MKYTVETEINRSREKVVALFDDPGNLSRWMEGLEKFEHIGGEPGAIGARSRLTFNIRNRKMEMIETITVRNLPSEFSGTYETKGVFSTVKNFFYELPGDRTRYISEQEYRFSGMMKLIAFFMPGAFRKQSEKHLAAFKKFVEAQP